VEAIVHDARTGLIIGKFMPPHRGHLHLIDVALSQVETLVVLVCSLEREPIPGALRAEWVRTLAPRARVVHVTDENPSEPHEHPDFWSIWIATIRRHVLSPIDVVFTSEDYGEELAARLGARHVMVDPARRRFPVSGTRVRANPIDVWEFIPDIVRGYFMKRVVVTGSESTGKTTLAADLARHFATVCVPEFARAYLDEKAARTGLPLDETDVEPIARGQIAAEDRGVATARGLIVLDTDLVSTTVYARHYYGRCPEWIEQAARDRRADLYLLCDIDVPWVSDPQRDRPHMRSHMHALFVEALEALGARYVTIRGSWGERRATAVAVVSSELASRSPSGGR
jgi:HTH-type transcriptional regulator, transcriptional repressor of NAD biosynthesis genes